MPPIEPVPTRKPRARRHFERPGGPTRHRAPMNTSRPSERARPAADLSIHPAVPSLPVEERALSESHPTGRHPGSVGGGRASASRPGLPAAVEVMGSREVGRRRPRPRVESASRAKQKSRTRLSPALLSGTCAGQHRDHVDCGEVPPAGFEPAHTAPEAVALSPELRGLCRRSLRRRVEHYQLRRGGHERSGDRGGNRRSAGKGRAPLPHAGGAPAAVAERSPARGRKWVKPGRSRRWTPSLMVCLACPVGSLWSMTTR